MAAKKSRRRHPRKHQRQESLFTRAGTARKRTPRTFRRGKRPGRPRLPGARLRHTARPDLDGRYPVHITWHVTDDIPNLRGSKLMAAIRRAFIAGKRRFGFRLVHFNVQSNHIHLKCEAEDKTSLSRGLKGLAVRIAKAINKVLGRKGRVFDDRYHCRILRTPREVRWALGYVLNNTRRHNADLLVPKTYARTWLDLACSSADYFPGWKNRDNHRVPMPNCPIVEPTTWLLREGWKKVGKIPIDHTPGPRAG